MNNSYITRRIDDLGRVHIPREVREKLEISQGDEIELSIENGTICLRKKIKTRYDRIRSMSIDEMAEEITLKLAAHLNKYSVALGNDFMELTLEDKNKTVELWKQYLKSEVEEE